MAQGRGGAGAVTARRGTTRPGEIEAPKAKLDLQLRVVGRATLKRGPPYQASGIALCRFARQDVWMRTYGFVEYDLSMESCDGEERS